MRMLDGRMNIAVAAGLCLALSAGVAQAQEGEPQGNTIFAAASAELAYEGVVADLRGSGYTLLRVQRTFLGRIRITAQNNVHTREIVVSRTTGEIMRDVILAANTGVSGQAGSGSSSGSGGPGGGGGTVENAVKSTTKKATSTVKETVDKVTGGLGLGG